MGNGAVPGEVVARGEWMSLQWQVQWRMSSLSLKQSKDRPDGPCQTARGQEEGLGYLLLCTNVL